MINRTTPETIKALKEGQVFVFGSNLGGKHGKGAAKTAMGWGAKYGQANGLQGKTYGISTKDKSVRRVLSIKEIKPIVDEFIEFAKKNPHLTFLVTEIGCGLSGYKPKDIAPLFEEAVDVFNIHLPARFWHKLKKEKSNMNHNPHNLNVLDTVILDEEHPNSCLVQIIKMTPNKMFSTVKIPLDKDSNSWSTMTSRLTPKK